jgi:hypothetical protein
LVLPAEWLLWVDDNGNPFPTLHWPAVFYLHNPLKILRLPLQIGIQEGSTVTGGEEEPESLHPGLILPAATV